MFDQAPRPIVWAIGLTVFNAVVGIFVCAFWPDLEDRATVLTVGVIISLVMLGASLWLWRRSKWGGIAFIAVNVFNVVTVIPVLFQDDVLFAVGGVISALLSIAAIVLVFRPEARPYWRTAGGPVAAMN